MSEEDNLEMFGLFCVPPYWWLLPPTLSTQMFPNLDHFVWELSVSKTSASPCVGIENPLFITLDLPSPFSQMSSHDVENTLRKMNQLESRLGKVRKSTLIQSLKFLSFLTDVTTTGIESPTAAKMSQPKTISHKVFPIPHYLTTWPSDYLTIWRLFDYLVTGWRELEPCKARVGSREGTLIIPMTDWPLAYTAPSGWFSYISAHLTICVEKGAGRWALVIILMTDASELASDCRLYWMMVLLMFL